jgi:hypothetical protein
MQDHVVGSLYHYSTLKIGLTCNRLGAAGGLFSENRTKVCAPIRSRPLTLALVSLKGNESQRPCDGASLGLSREGCQAAVTMGLCLDCVAL